MAEPEPAVITPEVMLRELLGRAQELAAGQGSACCAIAHVRFACAVIDQGVDGRVRAERHHSGRRGAGQFVSFRWCRRVDVIGREITVYSEAVTSARMPLVIIR